MTTPTILDKIKQYKLEEIAAKKAEISLEQQHVEAQNAPAPRGFAEKLAEAARTDYGLIAEIKKASPSKGVIREDFDVTALAQAYEKGGATCLSVLTDAPSFQGQNAYLMQAHDACALPVLRKDFLFDPYQVVQSRALGADCILIIMAAVDDTLANELEHTAFELGMDVLIEVHNQDELERATALKSPLLGINNRDLNSFEVALDITRDLARRVPEDRLIVSESGLLKASDLAELATYGARAFLIGETLMRHEDVESATRDILKEKPVSGGL